MLTDFLLFGAAIWFWVAVLIFIIIAIASDANENGWWAGISFVAFAIVWYHWGNLGLVWPKFINWYTAPVYLVIGAGYAYFRTYFFGRMTIGPRVNDARYSWVQDYNRTAAEKLPTKRPINLSTDLELRFQKSEECQRAKNTNLQQHVFRWGLNWPFSMIWFGLSKFLPQFWDFVWGGISGFFNRALQAGIEAGDKAAAKQQK